MIWLVSPANLFSSSTFVPLFPLGRDEKYKTGPYTWKIRVTALQIESNPAISCRKIESSRKKNNKLKSLPDWALDHCWFDTCKHRDRNDGRHGCVASMYASRYEGQKAGHCWSKLGHALPKCLCRPPWSRPPISRWFSRRPREKLTNLISVWKETIQIAWNELASFSPSLLLFTFL